jgi:hypothetical protein
MARVGRTGDNAMVFDNPNMGIQDAIICMQQSVLGCAAYV